jgi:hypothetical protein
LGPRSFQLLTCENQTDIERDSEMDGESVKDMERDKDSVSDIESERVIGDKDIE